MISLLVLVLVAATPASPPVSLPASVKKTKAFQDWRGGRFLLEERWVALPQAGLQVGYFLVPTMGKLEGGKLPFEDAFFVVDARTGELVAPAVVRAASLNGCPDPGEVPPLTAEPAGANRADILFGKGEQRCVLQLRRTKDGWTRSLFPDEARSIEENFPKAARAMAKVALAEDGGVGKLQWSYLYGTRWLLAAPEEGCDLWAVDSLTGEVNETASEAMAQKICGCRAEATCREYESMALGRVATQTDCSGDGTSIPSCDCVFATTGEADVECHFYYGGGYSPGMMAQMEEDNPGWMEARSAGFEMQEMRENLDAFRALVTASRSALEAWKAGRRDEAIAAWTALYRKWITQGRPAEEDKFGEMAEEIVSLLGEDRDVRHASIGEWAEILNNLGFAMWTRKEWAQAEAAYAECSNLLQRTDRTRNVLNLNLGDLYRDMGNAPAAREAYERFLNGDITPAQRKSVERELRKLP